MTVEGAANPPGEATGNTRLAFILAMAMFVLMRLPEIEPSASNI